MEKRRLMTRELILCGVFIPLIAIGAWLKIPIPVVPFTLQFLFTMLAGLLLGGRLGAVSVMGYLALGLLGLPIFAEGGGIWYLLKPSFGYLIGFAVAAYVSGRIANKVEAPSYGRILAGNLIGLLVVYLIGMVYFYGISNYVIETPIAFWPLFLYCFILAVPGDLVLCFLGAALAKRLIPVMHKIRA
ncbi:MAG: biotin transporter BioY [Anaerovoracaceae bacterium]